MLLSIMEEYNINLLSTKIYWERPQAREDYKKFWEEYKKIDAINTKKEKELQKEILFIKKDLKYVNKEEKRYRLVIKAYKDKLVELGVMRLIKDSCRTLQGKYTKNIKGKKDE